MKIKQYLYRGISAWIVLVIALPMSHAHAQTWQYLGAQYSVNFPNDLAVGYSGATRTLYLAAGTDAVMVSTGSSISWARNSFTKARFVTCSPANPATVYAGKTGLLQKSTNSGATWTTI